MLLRSELRNERWVGVGDEGRREVKGGRRE
jgi:hypothetical protein